MIEMIPERIVLDTHFYSVVASRVVRRRGVVA